MRRLVRAGESAFGTRRGVRVGEGGSRYCAKGGASALKECADARGSFFGGAGSFIGGGGSFFGGAGSFIGGAGGPCHCARGEVVYEEGAEVV